MILTAVFASFLVSCLVCWVFLRFWRRRVGNELDSDAILGKLRREIGELITEINGTTERNIGLIENRLAVLSELVDRAGKTAGVLKRETEIQRSAEQVYTSLARSRPLSIGVDKETKAPGETVEAITSESLSTREKVLVLYRSGEASEAIAGKLGISRGEVELIISIHDRKA